MPAWVAPYRPSDDAVVLEQLPLRAGDPRSRELRALHAAQRAAPADPGAALALARAYFNLALGSGEPRYVGYAEAALAAWRRDASAPVPADVAVMQAELLQYRHRFQEARALLDEVLARQSNHVRALAWRAAIDMVLARYETVPADCERLRALGEKLLAAGCAAYLDATLGKAARAYAALTAALSAEPDARPTLKLWTLTVLAEVARRLGNLAAAESHYRAALALDESDQYTLAAYAELLAQQRRWADIATLLARWERSHGLAIVLARAEHALGRPGAKAKVAAVRERFAEAARRGDDASAQDEAWFLLELEDDARKALALALRNWAVQKEPRDAQLVLRAAVASRDPMAAAPVLDWMAATGIEDPILRELAARLRAR